jgi:predicted glycosyltransferase
MDWGIGHATRCIPVISKLRELGFVVVVAASGRPLEFIRKEHPDIQVIDFPGAHIRYSKNNGMVFQMIRMLPKILAGTWREHKMVRKIVIETGATLVISDNRYGCWVTGVLSVFMTHQMCIQLPGSVKFMQKVINAINKRFIRKYDICWIPDFEPHHGLAGTLSHPPSLPAHARYIGILSRFSTFTDPFAALDAPGFDILVMLSGPEPQRTILEEKILMQLVSINLQVAMVRGMPESDEAYVLDNRIHVFAHLDSMKLFQLISRSAMVICRSGYSSIMDMVTLGKKAIFIPTPGQPEQEYLAHYLLEKKIYFSICQDDFDLLYALEMSKNFPGMVIRNDYRALEEQIMEIMKRSASF